MIYYSVGHKATEEKTNDEKEKITGEKIRQESPKILHVTEILNETQLVAPVVCKRDLVLLEVKLCFT